MKPVLILMLLGLAPLGLAACQDPEPAPGEPSPSAAAGPAATDPLAALPAPPGEDEDFLKLGPADLEPLKADPPAGEPQHVLSQWQSLYLSRRKIGYVAQTLGRFPDGSWRVETGVFLKTDLASDQFGYIKTITADVDSRFRPRALDCRVLSGARQWRVRGAADRTWLELTRTADGTTRRCRVLLDEDVTFLSCTLPAALAAGRPGEVRRWTAIDESLGAVLPDPCLVQNLGRRVVPGAAGTAAIEGTAVTWGCGREQVAHLAADDGRVLRSVWQSSPLVGENASLTEARSLAGAPDGPRGPDLPGFDAGTYRDAARGFSLWVPPYPYVAHAGPDVGALEIVNLATDARLAVRLAAVPQATAAADPEAEAERVADLVEREWAARLEDVKAGPLTPTVVGNYRGFSCNGTARLGCTPLEFHNTFVPYEGRTYSVCITVPDRPVAAEPALADAAIQTLKLSAPEGPLPLQFAGDTVRSPYYGFELRRPGGRWSIPTHLDGPTAALEMARQDRQAVVIARVMAARPGQSLEDFARDQAKLAATRLGVTPPTPLPVTVDGRKAFEISYEGRAILADQPGRCTILCAPLGGRVLVLALVAAAGAEDAAHDLQQIRDSLKFLAPAPAE
jgi:hypothetical protein